jgi:hypothetical protein
MLNRGNRRLRLLPGENLPPPIGVGGRDPSAEVEALANMDMPIHRPSRKAAHQLGHGLLHFLRLRPSPCHPTSVSPRT